MDGIKALQLLLRRAGWQQEDWPQDTQPAALAQAVHACQVQLSDYSVRFALLQEHTLYVQCPLLSLPADEPELTAELCRQAARLTVCLWQERAVQVCLQDKELTAELLIHTDSLPSAQDAAADLLEQQLTAFLNACDFLLQQLQETQQLHSQGGYGYGSGMTGLPPQFFTGGFFS